MSNKDPKMNSYIAAAELLLLSCSLDCKTVILETSKKPHTPENNNLAQKEALFALNL